MIKLNIRKMKKIAFIILTISLVNYSCRNNTIEDDLHSDLQIPLYFTIPNDTFYIAQKFICLTEDSIRNTFTWDFGDGTILPDTSNEVKHQYLSGGNYVIKLYSKGVESEKDIYVYPGSVSYEVVNKSSETIKINSYVSNPRDYGSVDHVLNPNQQSDTIFSRSLMVNGGCCLINISLFVDTTEYLLNPGWCDSRSSEHNKLLITDTTFFTKKYWFGEVNVYSQMLKDLY